jgi:hypothetical protein
VSQIHPVIQMPWRVPRSPRMEEEGEIDNELINAIHSWFRTHGVRQHDGKAIVNNSWVNRYSNATYKEFRSMVESLIVLITKVNMMQLPRRWNSPLSLRIVALQSFLVQTHCMLDEKHQLRAWQRRGWITHE